MTSSHRFFFFFSSRRRHTRLQGDWSSDVCSSDLQGPRVYARRLSQRQALVCAGSRAASGAGGPCDRKIREGAVRRGSTKEYVRAGGEGDGGTEVRYQRPSLRGAKRRSNPCFFGGSMDCFASLAMTVEPLNQN